MKTRFTIDSNDYKGQLNLDLTINSGQTSQPAWILRNGYFIELVEVQGIECLIKVKQEYTDGPLEVIAESKKEIDEEAVRSS